MDTPGFDDTERSDADIAENIISFLCAQYELVIPLKGIICMHRITDNKVSGTAQRYLEIFRCLCGDNVLSNVILLTTMWSELRDKAVGFKRERELRKGFWKTMESKGSEIRSFDGSRAMAEGFVCRLMRKKNIVLSIQKELMDEEKRLQETRVGRLIFPRLERSIDETERKIGELKKVIWNPDGPPNIEERNRMERQMEGLRIQHQRQRVQSEKLRERPGPRVASNIEREKKKQKWKDRVTLFASIFGLVLTTTINVILPLAGVNAI